MTEQPLVEHRKRSFGFWLLIGGGLFVAVIAVLSLISVLAIRSLSSDTSLASMGGNSIGVIDLNGVITSPDTVVEQLRKFEADSSIKAIVLHIDSPGGDAASSQEIYKEVHQIHLSHKKPIVASIQSVGASGAYYAASGADKIYADDASIVGSIGVIMEWVNYGDLLKWAKLKQETFKAGSLKDAGSPTRDPTPEERAYLQALADSIHTQFIHDVAEGRNLPEPAVRAIATGRVWTGRQAIDLHLIDGTMTFREVILATAKQVKISGEPQIVKPRIPHKGLLDLLTGDPKDLFPDPGRLLERNARFYFLWK